MTESSVKSLVQLYNQHILLEQHIMLRLSLNIKMNIM